MIYVGIDPGRNTGVALSENKKITKYFTTDFWSLIRYVEEFCSPSTHTFVIEDPSLNKSMYARHGIHNKKSEVVARIGRNVGSNHEQAYLLIEYLNYNAYTVITCKPTTAKWSAEQLKAYTGINTRTNEHVRDAIKLVFGR